jgi:hypothetical protein
MRTTIRYNELEHISEFWRGNSVYNSDLGFKSLVSLWTNYQLALLWKTWNAKTTEFPSTLLKGWIETHTYFVLPLSRNIVYICSCCPGTWYSHAVYESTIFPDNNENKCRISYFRKEVAHHCLKWRMNVMTKCNRVFAMKLNLIRSFLSWKTNKGRWFFDRIYPRWRYNRINSFMFTFFCQALYLTICSVILYVWQFLLRTP